MAKYDQVDMIMKLADIHQKLYMAELSNARQELAGVVGMLTAISDQCTRIIDDIMKQHT